STSVLRGAPPIYINFTKPLDSSPIPQTSRHWGKTDARDAHVIADQARMRRDLQPIRPGDEAAIELKLLTGRRADARLTKWLANRKVRNARALAEAAVEAAGRQYTSVPGEKTIARLVHTLAEGVMALNEQIAEMDKLIEGRFREHELAEIVESVPGIGTVLGAEFLAGVGGNLDGFASPDALAAFAGVAPAPRDSGKVSGNLHRPTVYHRRLQRVFYTSALVSIRCDPNSRKFYDRKRAEGKRHVQAVMALARRRVNVLWALVRDRRCYHITPPATETA
ncbi:IS110 family transposase, partial [Kitasatospora sp. NPDC096204]|uniref:IS110 family transposase n=1 Tax=Kitasatospora sp. NPDC096204 TaxID=3364094 RepID=UPI0038306390